MSASHESRTRSATGRGARANPANRFKPLDRSTTEDWLDDPSGPAPDTEFWQDASKSILSPNDSPDIPFTYSANPYRGCEHGCAYCYARPTHEYLELSAGIDFESKIGVKQQAPQLLHRALSKKNWQPQVIALSGVTDAYQPVERKLGLTRRCLQVALDFRNPVAIITKNHLVTRDIDVLSQLTAFDCAAVYLSITTLDTELARKLEPRASTPENRLDAVRALNDAGVPTGVLVAPVVPGLTDHELPAILKAAKDAGAQFAGYQVLRLPFGLKDLFRDWLETHVPTQAGKVLNRIREVRGGELNETRFGARMKGEGVYAEQIKQMFQLARKQAGFAPGGPRLSTDHFRDPTDRQEKLF
ncbi:PA0069 family radical SAM protein [Nitrospina watsonii]|uniref:Repair photolyase protein n=1 Tax=Nitrospina watsonii TaxID=1323948 RepID=A0ABM9H9W5_9BACT|nr:PA0069 family radical SAM protein [Nitrospina watsonii]CAI2716927.1 Repair photolyase protein [Nitrospina watsonii]